MKKMIVGLSCCAMFLSAADVTVSATMNLMNQGIQDVQEGFLYNNKTQMKKGIDILVNANSIFSKVDVATFIPKNHKVGATKKISKNMTESLMALKKDIDKGDLFSAQKSYAKALGNCLACHTIVRGW